MSLMESKRVALPMHPFVPRMPCLGCWSEPRILPGVGAEEQGRCTSSKPLSHLCCKALFQDSVEVYTLSGDEDLETRSKQGSDSKESESASSPWSASGLAQEDKKVDELVAHPTPRMLW